MAFDLYFTGVSRNSEAGQFLLENEACILLSQLNDRSEIKRWVETLKTSNYRPKLFIDSGSFSAWTLGKTIDLDAYISFINENHEYFALYTAVDVIPGKPRSKEVASPEQVKEAAQKSWDNYLYMRSRVQEPEKLLYTFHVGESEEFLSQALNYEDELGKIQYIAFGGLVGKPASIISSFLTKCFDLIKKSSNPNVKTHVFGVTRTSLLSNYPATSSDSTSAVLQAAMGTIVYKGKTLRVSDQSIYASDNIANTTPLALEQFKQEIEGLGFSLEDLQTSSEKRLAFNCKSLYLWSQNYEYVRPTITKASLF